MVIDSDFSAIKNFRRRKQEIEEYLAKVTEQQNEHNQIIKQIEKDVDKELRFYENIKILKQVEESGGEDASPGSAKAKHRYQLDLGKPRSSRRKEAKGKHDSRSNRKRLEFDHEAKEDGLVEYGESEIK